MEKIDKGHPLSQSTDFVAQNIETLKTLFPTIVKEGKIDIKELQALLGDDVETEDEYYRFTWAGKSMARREANKPSTATLRTDKESSKDWDTTQNIFIEGDNLEVLKLLQKSYANKIKMIYIDPPYNTGKDFVYKDNYNDNLSNYLAITGQVDEEGKRINTNSESDGRYHSNWLNMMYPRLKLARNLLKDDGVIFISIDDNEAVNLKKACDEIYGEENFIGQLIWKSRQNKDNRNISGLSVDHEYVFCYSRSFQSRVFIGSERKVEQYKNPDNDPRGPWVSGNMVGILSEDLRPNCHYDLINPATNINYGKPKLGWRYDKNSMSRMILENRIIWPENKDGRPRKKVFLNELNDELPAYTSIIGADVYTRNGTKTINKLFEAKIFDFPKPFELIKDLMEQIITPDENELILDFFAGSGSTAHATIKLNSEDAGNRKFICVQLPEPTHEKSEAYKAGYKTISEITKERIRRAGEKIKYEMKEDLFSEQGKTLDIGFRAFKLDSSNIRAWDGSPEALEENLLNAGKNIKENRTEEDVLYEILLKYGLDLTLPIEQKAIAVKQVFNIGMGALFICLGDNITTAVAEGIGKWKEDLQPATSKVIFKDTGFTDVEKTNSMQILKRYGILEVNTI
jgi:adenine-specific DNA-methyltransferase